ATFMLLFKTQSEHSYPCAPVTNHTFKAEVTFCVRGVITPPCGTPCLPLALNMIFSRCNTSTSSTRLATFANSRSCRTLSKEVATHYPPPRHCASSDDPA